MSWIWRKISDMAKKEAKDTDIENDSSKKHRVITREALQEKFKDIDDLIMKELPYGEECITIIYLAPLVSKDILEKEVFEPLKGIRTTEIKEAFKTAYFLKRNQFNLLLKGVFEGDTFLIFPEGMTIGIHTYGPPERSITTSEVESTILGPQDSFTESLDTNLSLIKRRICSYQLKTKKMKFGLETNNDIAILYMDNIADKNHLKEVMNRIMDTKYEGLLTPPVLNQMIKDNSFSIFPQFILTKRPDQSCELLLDGRIIILLNGGTEAVICPATFIEMFSSPEDEYNNWIVSTFLRNVRFWGFFITIFLTSTYVSVLTYHQEMLPPNLLTLLSESRSRVPFPPVIEVIFIELVIDILREAGARMPSKVGQTIGIVGGIVIGTAAVEAGLASNILIVIVAVSALLSFLPTNYLMSNASRVIRYFFIVAAGIYGMYGQMLTFALLMGHLASVTSLKETYMTIIPRKASDLENSVFRAPIAYMVSRMGVSKAKKELIRSVNKDE